MNDEQTKPADLSQRLTTGIGFLDSLLGANYRPRRVYGLLGPIGSGKTTFSMMIAASAAKQAFLAGQANRVVWYLSFEERGGALRERAIAFLSGVTRKSLRLNAGRELPIKDVLRKCGARPDSCDALFGHLAIADSRCVQQMKNIPAIKSYINDYNRNYDKTCGMVVIDYVGALARLASDISDFDTEKEIIGRACEDARAHLAEQFDCPVWLVHQLSGAENEQSTFGHRPNPRAAAGNQHFSEGIDGLFVLGQPRTSDSACSLSCHRGTRVRSTVVQLRGNIATFVPFNVTDPSDLNRLKACRVPHRLNAGDIKII